MGLEAKTICHMSGESFEAKSFEAKSFEVRALLESRSIILRGALKKTLAIHALSDIAADETGLSFRVGETTYRLDLGGKVAAKWAEKLAAPAPSLASKLGLSEDKKAVVWGGSDDAVLNAALDGRRADIAADAAMAILIASEEDVFIEGLTELAPFIANYPIWIVYPKGSKSPVNDTSVREYMRENGFIDSKACAVSDELTATRYGVVR